jgi:hypothetical protein
MKGKKFLYNFVGGELNGKLWHYAALEVRHLITGYNKDLSELRSKGVLELDGQPLIDGYLTPMYDGVRYEVNGKLKYEFECTEEEKQGEPIHIIRYETQEVYNMLSN